MKTFHAKIEDKTVKMYGKDEVDRFLSEIMDEVKYFGCSELVQKIHKLYIEKDFDTSET